MSDLLCHIHVGMPKTGTTSIQETFCTVHGQSTQYLPLQSNNHSMVFANVFEAEPWRHKHHIYMDRSRADVLEIRARQQKQLANMAAKACQNELVKGFIFSGERLSNATTVDKEAMQRFRDFFSSSCSEFKVYGYIRPVFEFQSSAFQQRIRVWGKTDIDGGLAPLKYRMRFEKFDQVFGQSNVSLRRFTRRDLIEGDVVRDLAAQIGLDLTGHKIIRSNESLCLQSIALLFAIRRSEYVPDQTRHVALAEGWIVKLLSKLKGGKFILEPSLAFRASKRDAKDIDWIEKRISASVTDMPPSSDRPIRSNQELLEIAAESRGQLNELDGDSAFTSGGFNLSDMKKWVEQGLNTAHPYYRSSSSIRRLRRKTCS